jgi:RNA polymerase sigma-70 factor, ECF subfamily
MDGESPREFEPAEGCPEAGPSSRKSDEAAGELDSGETILLVDRWRAGDEEAARLLSEWFRPSLLRLAGVMLPDWLQRRLGPEDIVQSVFRSFFDGLRRDEFHLRRSGDLWVLLIAMTRKKLQKRVEFHLAGKRSPRSEVALPAQGETGCALPTREVAVDEMLAVRDELLFVLNSLDPRGRRVLELRLQDFDQERIAGELGMSTRTVRRELDRIYHTLTNRLRAVS